MNRRDCGCPYCDRDTPGDICSPCDVRIAFCPSCGVPQPGDATVCTGCGGKLDEQPVGPEGQRPNREEA